jgi:hypothetical protein
LLELSFSLFFLFNAFHFSLIRFIGQLLKLVFEPESVCYLFYLEKLDINCMLLAMSRVISITWFHMFHSVEMIDHCLSLVPVAIAIMVTLLLYLLQHYIVLLLINSLRQWIRSAPCFREIVAK